MPVPVARRQLNKSIYSFGNIIESDHLSIIYREKCHHCSFRIVSPTTENTMKKLVLNLQFKWFSIAHRTKERNS